MDSVTTVVFANACQSSITSLVDVLVEILDRRDGCAYFDIDMAFIEFKQVWVVGDDISVRERVVNAVYLLCPSEATFSTTISRVRVVIKKCIGAEGFRITF